LAAAAGGAAAGNGAAVCSAGAGNGAAVCSAGAGNGAAVCSAAAAWSSVVLNTCVSSRFAAVPRLPAATPVIGASGSPVDVEGLRVTPMA
jgi:hypothetical protein